MSEPKAMNHELKPIAERMIKEALHSVDPYNLILDQLRIENNFLSIQEKHRFDLKRFNNIYVVGAGKGTAPMAAAIEKLFGKRIKSGCISVKYGHAQNLKRIQVLEAGHPIPDANTLRNTERILDLVDRAELDDLVIVLLTGGGSALLELLPNEIDLKILAELNQLLLSSGAAIDEINTIRKHISFIKGGRLAKRCAPATILTLILSDVIGDPTGSIASGPTAPDPTTFAQAVQIIQKYDLADKIPAAIFKYLERGLNQQIEETPKSNDQIFNQVHNFIIGNNALALRRLESIAVENGFHTALLTDRAQGEAREIARLIAGIIKSCIISGFPVASPGCIILGGEPTVTLHGKGKGGRNQELVLALLGEVADLNDKFYFCSVGSDGTDGPTDAAGAWIDERTAKRLLLKNLNALSYLKENDAYHLFKEIDQLIITGPTRTNVMDFIFCLF